MPGPSPLVKKPLTAEDIDWAGTLNKPKVVPKPKVMEKMPDLSKVKRTPASEPTAPSLPKLPAGVKAKPLPKQKLNTTDLRRMAPDALEQFYDHAINNTQDTLRSVDPNVEKTLAKAARMKLGRKGTKAGVGYQDFKPGYDSGKDEGIPYAEGWWNAANLVGNGQVERRGNDAVVRDDYDFNDPAYPDNTPLLPRLASLVLDDKPNMAIKDPARRGSIKQRAERYLGKKKGNAVEIVIPNAFAPEAFAQDSVEATVAQPRKSKIASAIKMKKRA